MMNLWKGERFHFIGIGGCGMSGLALVMKQLGAIVTGSDQKESIFSCSLREAGVNVTIGHSAASVPKTSMIVYSSAVRPDNPERAFARSEGLKEIHRSELLAELTTSMRTLAVCGAHGKTTTAALTAHVLTQCGIDPSYVIGGLPRPPMPHGYAGDSDLLIIEADESDRSLLRYHAEMVIVTNIDLDHIRDGGYQSKSDVAEVIGKLVSKARIAFTPAHTKEYFSLNNLLIVQPTTDSGELSSFSLDGHQYRSHAPGVHQIENAALVVRAAISLGCTPDRIADALRSFPGLARRFESVGKLPSGAVVIDDYAHHPAEIAAVIKATRGSGCGRVIVVFQPHLFSRTVHFAREFADALSLADITYVENIYPSRESNSDWPGASRELILKESSSAQRGSLLPAPNREELIKLLVDGTQPGDTVLVLGAGDIADLARALAAQSES